MDTSPANGWRAIHHIRVLEKRVSRWQGTGRVIINLACLLCWKDAGTLTKIALKNVVMRSSCAKRAISVRSSHVSNRPSYPGRLGRLLHLTRRVSYHLRSTSSRPTVTSVASWAPCTPRCLHILSIYRLHCIAVLARRLAPGPYPHSAAADSMVDWSQRRCQRAADSTSV